MYSCKHLTIFYINYRLHLQNSPGDMTTKTFKTTFSQTGACISLGFILKQAHRSSAQKTLCMNHCRREDTCITDPCTGCKLGVKERQKPFGAGLTSPPPPKQSHPRHCGDPVWALRSYGLKSFGTVISTLSVQFVAV